MKVIYLTIELVVGFFLLFIIVKFVGRKIINQVSPFTFIAGIVLGELLGNALYDHEIGLGYIIYSHVLLESFYYLSVEYLDRKSLIFLEVSFKENRLLL